MLTEADHQHPTSKDASSSSTRVFPPGVLVVGPGKPGCPGPPGPPTGCVADGCWPENIPLMEDAILICFRAVVKPDLCYCVIGCTQSPACKRLLLLCERDLVGRLQSLYFHIVVRIEGQEITLTLGFAVVAASLMLASSTVSTVLWDGICNGVKKKGVHMYILTFVMDLSANQMLLLMPWSRNPQRDKSLGRTGNSITEDDGFKAPTSSV